MYLKKKYLKCISKKIFLSNQNRIIHVIGTRNKYMYI